MTANVQRRAEISSCCSQMPPLALPCRQLPPLGPQRSPCRIPVLQGGPLSVAQPLNDLCSWNSHTTARQPCPALPGSRRSTGPSTVDLGFGAPTACICSLQTNMTQRADNARLDAPALESARAVPLRRQLRWLCSRNPIGRCCPWRRLQAPCRPPDPAASACRCLQRRRRRGGAGAGRSRAPRGGGCRARRWVGWQQPPLCPSSCLFPCPSPYPLHSRCLSHCRIHLGEVGGKGAGQQASIVWAGQRALQLLSTGPRWGMFLP